LIREPGPKDSSFRDRCFQCPVGKFQLYSTNYYNDKSLQPSVDAMEDPESMCAKCPIGASCPRSTVQERDFGFTVGIHILPDTGFWFNSKLIATTMGSFIESNASMQSARRVDETKSNDFDVFRCKSAFCNASTEIVTIYRCASKMCQHQKKRPREWGDRQNPDNPDWMCGSSGRTGLACGLCRDGTALTSGKICQSCGNAENLWVFQLVAIVVTVVIGSTLWYLIVWRRIFIEEHDYYQDGRTQANIVLSRTYVHTKGAIQSAAPAVSPCNTKSMHSKKLMDLRLTDECIAIQSALKVEEDARINTETVHITSKKEVVDENATKKEKAHTAVKEEIQEDLEDIQEDLEDIQRSLKEIEEWTSDFNQPFETDFYTLQDKGNSGQGKPEDSFVDLKQAFAPIWSYIVKFVAATIGSEDEDAEHIRRTLMGFFKIVMSYFQVTASFLKNFAVDWGERLDAFLNKLSILNLDLYKLPGVNCMVMLQNPTRSFQVAFYIFMVPFCLLGLALPRLLCAVAEPWMLTVWERSRKTQKGVPDLITEYQMNLTGINQADARRLQIAKDEARKIRERRTIVSFHRATPFVRFFVIVWAVYLVFGLFVCCELVVQSSLNAVQELDTLAKLAVGTFCQSSLERLGARTASKCDISGDKDKETCLFCGYGEYRTSTDDCLCCPCGSELDVINADCTGACRKLGEYGNASIEWPLYKAIAEKKCFPKAGTECLIIEIMGRYQFVPRNSQDRDIEYDVGCRDSKQGLVVITVENSQSSNHGDLNKELQFKDPFKGLKQQPGSEINPDMSCPHSQARQEYRSYTDARSWQQAENICIEWGGHLASFESFGDMNSSVSLMWQSAIDATSIQTSTRDKPAHPIENSHGTQKNIHKEAWIGLHRNSSVVTDPWKWIDGKNCTYAASNWWGFSPGWSLASEAWCNSDDQSRFVLSPPQPRPIPGHDCVHITWNGPASTCAQEKGSNVSSNTMYSGWTNGPCNATKSFVCSKQLASRDNFGSYCDNVKPPTSWPPASLDQMLGNGTYYWKSMFEITKRIKCLEMEHTTGNRCVK